MKAKVIVAEPQFSPKIADAIAQEAGARVLMLDPIGGEKGRETYIDLMRYNLAVMEKAMK
jgi:zinc transport system substrate-binding protein